MTNILPGILSAAGVNEVGYWGVVWAADLTSDGSGNGGYCWRTRVALQNVDFTKVKVNFEASSATSFDCDNCSIGIQDTDEVTTSTPTELLFSGGSGFTLSSGSEIESDELTFSKSTSQDIIINMDIASGTNNPRKSDSGGDGVWFKAATDGYATADPSLTLRGSDDIGGLNKVYGFSTRPSYRYLRLYITDDNSGTGVAIKQMYWKVGDFDFPIQTATSNSAPSPLVISASTEFSATYAAWKAFDKNTGAGAVYWEDDNNDIGTAEWLKIDLGAGNEIAPTGAGIHPLTVALTPKTFKFQGSNDDSTWTDIHSETDLTTGWSDNTLRTFTF